jgi:basic membrane lipoprotein Med (substrate-binding protein (PBP1-ABC) superfamily)
MTSAIKKSTLLAIIVVLVVIAIVAGVVGYYMGRQQAPTAPTKVKMAFIFPGSVTDTAWNEAGYRAMEAFRGKHPEVEIAWVQGVYDPAQIESVVRSYVQQGYNLIVGVGFQFGEPMAKIAKEVTGDVYFLVIAGAPQYIGPRVSIADARTDQSGFIIGYLMMKLSRTKSVAFVAGMAVAELSRSEVGQRAGIKYAGYDPDKVYHVYYVGDFHDVVKAKLGTITLIEQYNVDVIKAMGDGVQLGAISAAKEKGVYISISGTYHPEIYPEGVFLYEVWRWEVILEQWYNDYLTGELKKGGKAYWISLENGGIELIKGPMITDELWREVQSLIEKIIKGEISTGFTPTY